MSSFMGKTHGSRSIKWYSLLWRYLCGTERPARASSARSCRLMHQPCHSSLGVSERNRSHRPTISNKEQFIPVSPTGELCHECRLAKFKITIWHIIFSVDMSYTWNIIDQKIFIIHLKALLTNHYETLGKLSFTHSLLGPYSNVIFSVLPSLATLFNIVTQYSFPASASLYITLITHLIIDRPSLLRVGSFKAWILFQCIF